VTGYLQLYRCVIFAWCIKWITNNKSTVHIGHLWIYFKWFKQFSPKNAMSGSQYMFAVNYRCSTPMKRSISKIEFPLNCYLKIELLQ
jgi:hypothetical protein